jgi:hypothetical protein
MTTYLRQHGLMSFISLNIPEREINLHFVNSAGLQQNGPFCVLLKFFSLFHGFIILYLKLWLHRFYIQNAAECSILRPSEKKDPLPLLVCRGLACIHKAQKIIWHCCPFTLQQMTHISLDDRKSIIVLCDLCLSKDTRTLCFSYNKDILIIVGTFR